MLDIVLRRYVLNNVRKEKNSLAGC